MALAGNVGATIGLGQIEGSTGWAFGEDQGVYVVTVRDALAFRRAHNAYRITPVILGSAGGSDLVIESSGHELGRVPLADLRAAHEGFFPKLMGRELTPEF